jgi:hypothetical protein
MNRRRLLQALAAAGAGAAAAGVGSAWRARQGHAAAGDPYFLVVLCGFGGASIIDSFMPIRASEATDPATLDCFADAEVLAAPSVSPLRIVDPVIGTVIGQKLGAPVTVPLSPIAAKHYKETMVTTLEATSVNHAVAQHRALTGGGGRATLQELVARKYGKTMPLPNVNMASIGFLEPGEDATLEDWCFAEAVPQPLLKPISLSGHRGIQGAPPAELLDLARSRRDDHLDPASSFYQTFRHSDRLARWKAQRAGQARTVEASALIDKLIFVEENPGIVPLSQYGLMASEDAPLLAQVFPDILSGSMDPLEQQAALAYLLIKHRVSVAVTISPTFAPLLGGTLEPWQAQALGLKNPPLAFDGAHQDHRSAQAIMWHRVLRIADKLVDLLKAVPFDAATGETLWDRTMIHIATDFGRDKRRPADWQVAGFWGTGHDLNNGTVTISPLVNGNTLLGDVFRSTSTQLDGQTYGFDLKTGKADPSRKTSELEHYAGLCGALGVQTPGLPEVPVMRKQG